jgi:hypothetical protein
MENNDNNSLCIKCNKSFRDIYELKRHQSKKFPCDRYEKITENGQIKYKCSYCKKLFSGLQSANYHQNHSCDSAKNTIKKNNDENIVEINKDDNLFLKKKQNKLFDLIELSSTNNSSSILDSINDPKNSGNILISLFEQLKIQNDKILKLESELENVKSSKLKK